MNDISKTYPSVYTFLAIYFTIMDSCSWYSSKRTRTCTCV